MGCVTKVVVVIVRNRERVVMETSCVALASRAELSFFLAVMVANRTGLVIIFGIRSPPKGISGHPFVLPMIIDVTLLGFRPEEVKRDSQRGIFTVLEQASKNQE